MLSQLLRKLLFNLIHLVIYLLVAVKNVLRIFRTKQWLFNEKQVTKSDITLILKHVPRDSSKLKHLVVLADTNYHTLSDLARVLIWSLIAGVPYVSFYDVTGSLEKQEEKLFLEVEKNKKGVPGCIKWSHKPDLNGYNNGSQAYTVIVNIFNKAHGRDKLAQCIEDIAFGRLDCEQSSKEFTAKELNDAISCKYAPIPDPDLALYSGSLCCTHGLLPWHIRLTEFIQLSPDKTIGVNNYIDALYKYHKCDQRFGK